MKKGVSLLLNKDYIKEHWVMIAILFLSIILRLYTIGDRSLWMDEIWQANFYYSNSISELINNAAIHAQPPLDYFIGYVLIKLFDFSETIVRLPAAIFGTLTVFIVYIIAKRLFSQGIAIIATILTAISAHLIQYSQEVRPYSIFIFALFVTIYFLLRAFENGSKLYWLGYGISLYFLLLTRGLEPIIAILTFIIVAIVYFRLSKTTINTIVVSAVAFFLYLPFFMTIYYRLQQLSDKKPDSSSFWNDMANRLNDFPVGGLVWIGYDVTKPVTLFFLIFIAAGLYAIFSYRDKISARMFVSIAIIMPILHVLIYSYQVDIKTSPFYLRYYLYVLPFLYIITAKGFIVFRRRAMSLVDRRYVSWGVGLILLLMFISSGTNLHAYYKSQKHDWRGVANFIKKSSDKEKIIVMDSPIIEYGRWKPRFEGKYIYYRDVLEYNLNELVSLAIKQPETKKGIFLVLYYWEKGPYWEEVCEKSGVYSLCAYVASNLDGNKFADKFSVLIENIISDYRKNKLKEPCCKELCRNSFYHMCVYQLDYDKGNFLERVEALIDKMIIEYPQNDSQVSLYINRGRIAAARGDDNKALQYFDMARKHVPKRLKGQLEKEISRIL